MRTETTSSRRAAVALALAASVAACAHVGQDQFDTEIASLRDQMVQGDEANRQSVDELGRRSEEQLAELSARLDGLVQALTEMQSEFDFTVQRLETAIRFDVPVYFGFDEATLREGDLSVLDRFSSVVSEYYPTALVTVEGFTDPAGSVEYNRQLGLNRAEAVRTYLVESGGFVAEQVRAVSYGEDEGRLVAPGQAGHEAGWENRRVAFVVEHLGTVSNDALVTDGTR